MGKLKSTFILRLFQALLYLAFVFLWFKDNSPALKNVKIPYLVPLVPLLILMLFRLTLWLSQKKFKLSFRWNQDLTIIVILVLLAIAVRLPFYANYFGILNSDDAMPLLQAKHMTEGDLPAIYYYGQTRVGSLPFHVYALVFKLFGYSVFLGVLAYFLPFLGFIIILNLLCRAMFSNRTLAFILALFFCLPFRHLFSLSFYIGSNITYVYFLGGLALYLSFLVYKKNKSSYIPVIGFCLGLAFWTYQFSIIFAICAALFIMLQVRFHLKPYFSLAWYFLIGFFPGILFEIISPIKTFNFLFSGREFFGLPWERMIEILRKLTVLVSGEQNILNLVYLAIILAGIVGLIFNSIKKRKFLPENIFGIYFLAFLLVYALSRFPIADSKLRYLYAFYFAIPFLLVSVLNLLRKKVKYVLMLCLFLIMIIFSNIRDVHESYLLTKSAHKHLRNIVQSMIKTGEKHWLGTFWDVHLLTALSGEKIVGWWYAQIGDPRYFPYKYMLSYFNQGENNNYVFFKQPGSYSVTYKDILAQVDHNLDSAYRRSDHLLQIMDKLGINAKKEKIDDCWLVYNSPSSLLPVIMRVEIPQHIPELSLTKTESDKGWLEMYFTQTDKSNPKGFKINVEIEDFCFRQKSISRSGEETRVRLPLPDQHEFKLTYFLDYQGAKVPKTIRNISMSHEAETHERRTRAIVFLNGSIPGKQGTERYLDKESTIEINRDIEPGSRIRLELYSSLIFPEFYRYGDYFQELEIYLNGEVITERKLDEGENQIEVAIPPNVPSLDRAILTLRFKYHLPYPDNPRRKTAAILKNIEILN